MLRSIALLGLAGCSFLVVDAPPPPCTTNRIPPVVDTVVAVIAAAGAVYFAQSDEDTAGVGVVVEGGLAVGFGASAIAGWRRTGRCARAIMPRT